MKKTLTLRQKQKINFENKASNLILNIDENASPESSILSIWRTDEETAILVLQKLQKLYPYDYFIYKKHYKYMAFSFFTVSLFKKIKWTLFYKSSRIP